MEAAPNVLRCSTMNPPRFSGPTHPCPRCGEVVGAFKGFRAEHLAHVGWRAYQVENYQNWCGHAQEVIPVPRADGLVSFVPVLGGGAVAASAPCYTHQRIARTTTARLGRPLGARTQAREHRGCRVGACSTAATDRLTGT
jgi:hypothetical protein